MSQTKWRHILEWIVNIDARGKPRKSHTRQEFSVPRDWLLRFSNCADLSFLEWGSPVPPCLKWPSDPASSWMPYRHQSAFAIATGDRAARRLYFATSDDYVYNNINEWREEMWTLKIGYLLVCSKSRPKNYTVTLIVVLPCILIIMKFFFPTNALFIKT
jgi:hypothetical protein